MSLWLAAMTLGLVLGVLALGVWLSFRVLDFPDITVDGSFALGGCMTAALVLHGWHPGWATLGGMSGGMLAGAATGFLHVRYRIHGLLSGILVMTALYSVNLRVMGRSNVPFSEARTLGTLATEVCRTLSGGRTALDWLGWEVGVRDVGMLAGAGLAACLAGLMLAAFLGTHLGLAMRATGENGQMMRALGVGVDGVRVLGLAMANGLVALSGSMLAQYQGFADVQMGMGMVVWGLASVILGEGLVGKGRPGLLIIGSLMGSVLFRLLVALALRWGLNPNDLKLVTAAFVFVALVVPAWFRRGRRGVSGAEHGGGHA